MPDTGAPWNIPYVAGTDLVADWPTDSQTLAEAIADGLDAATPAGLGTNVTNTVKVNNFTTTSTSFVPVTDLSTTITPTEATSKVLLLVSLPVAQSASAEGYVRVVRDATVIGDTSQGNSFRANWGNSLANREAANVVSFVILDSPATTSATTYAVEVKTGAHTMYIGRIAQANFLNVASITAIEVKA